MNFKGEDWKGVADGNVIHNSSLQLQQELDFLVRTQLFEGVTKDSNKVDSFGFGESRSFLSMHSTGNFQTLPGHLDIESAVAPGFARLIGKQIICKGQGPLSLSAHHRHTTDRI